MASRDEKAKHSEKLNGILLAKHNIFCHEKVYRSDLEFRLPVHVNRVLKILLDFECIICEADTDSFDEKEINEIDRKVPKAFYPIPRRQYNQDPEMKHAESKRRESLEFRRDGVDKACNYEGRGYKEDQWQRHIEKYFFKEFEDQGKINSRLPGFKFIHHVFDNYVVRGHRIRWTEAMHFRNRKKGRDWLTDPMPDIFFAFAINESHGFRRGCQLDNQYQNFEVRTLVELLEKEDLISSPIAALRRDGEEMSPADYYCYPWLVVEIKHDAVKAAEARLCYSQAANGASVALSMVSDLVQLSGNQLDACEVPPVITITFIGPEVKVWLLYSDLRRDERLARHRMQCIWEGSIATMWGSLQLQCILENAKAWALRILKPTLSSYIDSVRSQKPTKTEHRTRLEHDTVEASEELVGIEDIVDRAQTRIEQLRLKRRGDEDKHIRLAIMLQEVLKAHEFQPVATDSNTGPSYEPDTNDSDTDGTYKP